MPLWAKVDVDMPTDSKLLGQPVATRHLWTCLICLAKRQDDYGAIRGYDCALLGGAFNIPRKAVAFGLTHFQAHKMVELDPDGTIRLLNFTKRQGEITVAEQREAWRDRQAKGRAGVTRDKPPLSPVTDPNVTEMCHASRVEVEEEEKKKEPSASSAAPPTTVPITELEANWPKDLLLRVKEAITSTRKSGSMAEGPWRAFLLSSRQFTPEIRLKAANEYLDRACATDGKGERYLLGIMRGETSRRAAPLANTAATERAGLQARRDSAATQERIAQLDAIKAQPMPEHLKAQIARIGNGK